VNDISNPCQLATNDIFISLSLQIYLFFCFRFWIGKKGESTSQPFVRVTAIYLYHKMEENEVERRAPFSIVVYYTGGTSNIYGSLAEE
jgi:hypothetical protein